MDAFLQLDELRLHYREWPNEGANLIVLLHAWPSSVAAWEPFATAMREDMRVVALDLRGHGESDWRSEYTWESTLADVDQALAALGEGQAAVVGHGGGGLVALLYAATRPETVRRVVAVDQVPDDTYGKAGHVFPERFSDPEELVRAYAERHWADGAGIDVLRETVARTLRSAPDGTWTWRRDPALLEAISELRFYPPEDDFWAHLGQVRCPALLVRGRESFGERSRFERAARTMRDATLVEIERSRHLPHLSNPAAFLATVRPFLLGP